MEARQATLNRLVRESDRYQELWGRYMSPVIAAIEAEQEDLRLNEVDIERIMAEDKKENSISQLVSNNTISANLASKYRKVRQSEQYGRLRQQWMEFKEATDKAFKTPVKMKVFTYENKAMEKDTTMSPLDSIKYHRMFLQIGSMAVDPLTGYVKAWVGGIKHKYFQYDHVRTSRQVG